MDCERTMNVVLLAVAFRNNVFNAATFAHTHAKVTHKKPVRV
jgi:hypothetical protein